MTQTNRTGHVIAWLSFVLGITVSIAANVLHAMEGTWTLPELVGAGFWPLALLLSIEVLTRVMWPAGWLWGVARFGGVGVVALVAAVLSYRHMQSLLGSWGEDPWNAHLGPLAVDGLMLVSATALLAISRTEQASEVEANPDRPHVFTWPEPIGPEPAQAPRFEQPPPWEVVAAVQARDEADSLEPEDLEMLQRILAGVPDPTEPLPRLEPWERLATQYAEPIGPEPEAQPEPVDQGPSVEQLADALADRLQGLIVEPPTPDSDVLPAETEPPKPPKTPKQPRAPRTPSKSSALHPRYDDAYRYWQANPEASAGDLLKVFNIPRSTAARYLKDWRDAQSMAPVS